MNLQLIFNEKNAIEWDKRMEAAMLITDNTREIVYHKFGVDEITKAANEYIKMHSIPSAKHSSPLTDCWGEARGVICELLRRELFDAISSKTVLHKCQYCGVETTEPDYNCYKAPNA